MNCPDEPSNETAPMLRAVPANRRPTLIARTVTPASTDGPREYRFDIVLQGRDETVFFAIA
jgi:protocatechuate 3,4-dioxygenase alpha subunit